MFNAMRFRATSWTELKSFIITVWFTLTGAKRVVHATCGVSGVVNLGEKIRPRAIEGGTEIK